MCVSLFCGRLFIFHILFVLYGYCLVLEQGETLCRSENLVVLFSVCVTWKITHVYQCMLSNHTTSIHMLSVLFFFSFCTCLEGGFVCIFNNMCEMYILNKCREKTQRICIFLYLNPWSFWIYTSHCSEYYCVKILA